jgi:hypothetical protein
VDFDGDGAFDTAVGDAAGLRLDLSHRGALILDARRAVAAVTAYDVDRDGDLDLVTIEAPATPRIWRNDGAGRFSYQRPRSRGKPAQWSRGTLDQGRGRDLGAVASGRRDRLDARIALTARFQPRTVTTPAFSSSSRLHASGAVSPGSPRAPPVC